MADTAQIAKEPRLSLWKRRARRCIYGVVLAVCAVVGLEALVLEPCHVPTGSMAPALRGHHRVGVCACCGAEVVVGRASADTAGTGAARFYQKAFCQNCGAFPVRLNAGPETPGDRILVNRTAYICRAPVRWEIAVFRLLGAFYIKRILGLPGEEILIHDGDVYVNGELLRKSFAQAKRLALLLYTQERAAGERWEHHRAGNETEALALRGGSFIEIDGRQSPALATYRNYLAAAKKCDPICDEYAYNGGVHADSEFVHDFLIETELEIADGSGTASLRLCDGGDWVEVLVPVGEARRAEAFAWPMLKPEEVRKVGVSERVLTLRAGQRCRIELAFVDRRLTLRADGKECLCLDLPASKDRAGVERPFQVQADGVRARLHGFRLSRDVHYGQQGTNGVHGSAVRLGPGQYFLLGDNSPNSEDSRFWPDGGCVNAADLIGAACLMHGSGGNRSGLRWLP